ncbi:FecR family protein [Fodinibius salsisoli]|uniref:FecR domain-containing protein n=1 Tax=Fodinibius salsisoli TaxID=2820877 RepID=A0ABT3PKY3_9BACT|nr:FecR domain-containing protein [Fodinibius salsisoli]MCW9706574.1 FecR domain-containing protein [Fodinibius salsisoli]
MNSKEINWNKLLRYIRGDSSHEEQKEVEEWASSSSENKNVISFLEGVWQASAEEKEDWDVDSAWLRYEFRYGKDFQDPAEEGETDKSRIPTSGSPQKEVKVAEDRKSGVLSWALVAAAAALVCLIVLYSYPSQKASVTEAPPMKEIVAKHGQRIHFRLSDGTKVTLNAGSKIIAPKVFSDSARTLQLEGQAFFDVATDSTRPFLVNTDRSLTKVLGTRFDVKAYPTDSRVEVTVAEGKVALQAVRSINDAGNAQVITRGYQGYLSPEGNASVTKVGDINSYIGWTKGQLVFNNDPFAQVKRVLERWYDIEISIASEPGDTLSKQRFTGSFTDTQSMDEVLEAIALSLNIKFKKMSDGSYTIYE